jgi:hypothetical protein
VIQHIHRAAVIIERAFEKQLERFEALAAAHRRARRKYESAMDTDGYRQDGSRTLH